MNGGSDVLTPDLFDTLIGRDMEVLLESKEINQKAALRSKIEYVLKSHPELLGDKWLVYVREDMLGTIMNVIDNLTITTTDERKDNNSNIRQTGIEKAFITKTKGMLLNNVIENFISVGLYGDASSIRIPLSFGKNGTTNDGKTKRAWNAWPGVKVGKMGVEITLSVGWEIAEQYNYNRVINAQLDRVHSAQYVWLEGGAVAWGIKKPLSIWAEAFVGAEWIKDPIVGIEQINRQYETLSGILFTVTDLNQIKKNPYEYFKDRIKKLEADSKYGKFIQNNIKHLQDNARFIAEVLIKKNIFTLLEKESNDKTQQARALNNLVRSEERRVGKECRSRWSPYH